MYTSRFQQEVDFVQALNTWVFCLSDDRIGLLSLRDKRFHVLAAFSSTHEVEHLQEELFSTANDLADRLEALREEIKSYIQVDCKPRPLGLSLSHVEKFNRFKSNVRSLQMEVYRFSLKKLSLDIGTGESIEIF